MNQRTQTPTRFLMVTACAGVFSYGILASFLGATLPEFRAHLHLDEAQAGALFTTLYFPQIVMVFLVGPLIDRFGKRPILILGSLGSALALLGASFAPSYLALAGLLLVLGLVGSFVNSGANTLIPELYPENPSAALNLANIFFGLGAGFFPFLVAFVATRLGLNPTLWMITGLVAVLALLAFLQKFPPPLAAGGFNWKEARQVATEPTVLLLAVVLFFYVALEVSTGGWISTYLEKDFGMSARGSRSVLTLFWATLLVGRLIASQLLKKARGPQFVLLSSLGAIVGLLIMVNAPSPGVAVVGVLVTGFFYAPVFPTTVGTASGYFPKLFGTVFGIIMAVGLVGGALLPWAIGQVARERSVATAFWLVVGTATLLFLTQLTFVRYEKKRYPS